MSKVDLSKYRGVVSEIPVPGQKRFRISIALFYDAATATDKMSRSIRFNDPDLGTIIKKIDFKKFGILSFIGDPEDEMEEFLDQHEDDLEKLGKGVEGYYVFSRSADLDLIEGFDPNKAVSPEKLDSATPELVVTPDLQAFFDHLSKFYYNLNVHE